MKNLIFIASLLALFVGGAIADETTSKLPIEISSDSLEVLQHENKAIFKGNVIAVQGTTRLKSDVMVVHYKQKAATGAPGQPEQAPQPKPTQAPAAGAPSGMPGEMGAITLIEVEGNVFVATPEEAAQGDKGDYHVDTRTIHLFGNNVTLTKDKNILRGTALEYNLDTGRSVLTNNGSTVATGNGGRVRGVFVPSDDPAKKPAAAALPPTIPNAPVSAITPAATSPNK